MKCLLCANVIDETKDVTALTLIERKEWGDMLSHWTAVSLVAQRNGGIETLITGHVCPKDLENLPFITLHI